MFWAFLIRIRIRKLQLRIRLLPSLGKNSKKNLDFYCFVTFLWLFICEEWCKCTSVPNLHPDPYVFGPPGSASGSFSQRCGSGSVPKCHGSPTLEKRWFTKFIHTKKTRDTICKTILSDTPLLCVCVCRTGVFAVGAASGGVQGAAGPPGHGQRGRQVGPQSEIWSTPHTRYRQANKGFYVSFTTFAECFRTRMHQRKSSLQTRR